MWCTSASTTWSSGPRRTSPARSRGSRARSKGRRPSATDSSRTRASACSAGRPRRSTPGQPDRRRGGDDLPRHAVRVREGRAQDLVAPHQLAEAPLQGGDVERPAQAHRRVQVVGAVARIELVQEPEPRLREGQRQRPRRAESARSAARPSRAGRRSATVRAARAASVGALEQGAQRQLHAERGADPRHHPGRQQRVAAQLEEAVVRPHPLDAQHLLPDRGQDPLARGRPGPLRSAAVRPSRLAPAGRGGRPCRWASAGRPPAPRRPTAPCSPAAARAGTPQLATRPGPSGRPRRRRPDGGRRACPPAPQRPPARRPACRARTASISRSSIRKPRTLTCWSIRPRKSISPPGRSGRGLPCGRGAPRVRRRRDPGRTSPRSARDGRGSRVPGWRRRGRARPGRRPASAAGGHRPPTRARCRPGGRWPEDAARLRAGRSRRWRRPRSRSGRSC